LNFKNKSRRLGGIFVSNSVELANYNNVAGLKAFRSFFDCEFDLLTFFEVTVALTLDRGKMHKDILSAFTGNEAITFGSIEPFDCTDDTF